MSEPILPDLGMVSLPQDGWKFISHGFYIAEKPSIFNLSLKELKETNTTKPITLIRGCRQTSISFLDKETIVRTR